MRTFCYYGHSATADKSQPPGETHKEMTEINSRHYGLLLLRKCGHFHAPQRDISLVFLSCYSGHFVQNRDSHNIKRHYDKGKFKKNHSLTANMRISCLQLVREATLQILRLRSYILFQMLRDKTFFFSLSYSAELLALRILNFPPRVSPRESTVSE